MALRWDRVGVVVKCGHTDFVGLVVKLVMSFWMEWFVSMEKLWVGRSV